MCDINRVSQEKDAILADIDKTTIDNLIKSIKTDEFNAQLGAAKRSIEKEKSLINIRRIKELSIKKVS